MRSALVALSATAGIVIALAFLPAPLLGRIATAWNNRPPEATPPPPAILAEPGELPAGPAGLAAWARYQGEEYRLAGSGFLLALNGDRLGVTAAHSLEIGNPQRRLERVAFALPGQAAFLAEFDSLHGRPGQARTGGDFTVDFVLLRPAGEVAPDSVLAPDPRGGPQPGERVALFGGAGPAAASGPVWRGTVQTAEPTVIWVLMDDPFEAGLLSGSPLISLHTGRVLGMAIAAAPRGGRLMIGFHPVGSLARLAEAASEFIPLASYEQ
jgi:hypothetical protein